MSSIRVSGARAALGLLGMMAALVVIAGSGLWTLMGDYRHSFDKYSYLAIFAIIVSGILAMYIIELICTLALNRWNIIQSDDKMLFIVAKSNFAAKRVSVIRADVLEVRNDHQGGVEIVTKDGRVIRPHDRLADADLSDFKRIIY